ncbi:MAG: ROK family protein, partial [Bacteroidaceae bacterium]
VVINNQLLTGDNGCGGDVWIMRNKKYPEMIAEESVSIRAVRRVYQEISKTDASTLTPKDIFDIAEGNRSGNKQAAIKSFHELGEMVGHALVNALNIVDGLVVIGGGVAGASKYILPGVMEEMNRQVNTFAGASFPSLQTEVFNLEKEEDVNAFFTEKDTTVLVPFSKEKVPYTNHKKTGITISTLGTNEAVALGAYSFALAQLDA